MLNYMNPRIKSIYPLCRLNSKVFRVGAQIGITKEFNDPTQQLWTLVNLLDGRPLDDVLIKEKEAFPDLNLTDDYIIDGINLLDEENLIEETLSSKEEEYEKRYMPNVNYFARFINKDSDYDRFRPQDIISNSTIMLLGLGGGGTNILTLLAGLGPKKIIIIDYDVVEEKNLGRQFLYSEQDIGKLKTDIAKSAIEKINSSIVIETHNEKIGKPEDIIKYINNVDLVISAIDEPHFVINRIVNKAIVDANVPCVFGGTQVSRGRVFSIIPGITGCFDCLSIYYTLTDDQFVDQFVGYARNNFKLDSIAYGPAIFQLTAAIVDEAVKILTGYSKPNSLSTQFEINYEDSSAFTHTPWPRYADKCPTCGSGTESDWPIFRYFKLFDKDNVTNL